MSLNIQTEMAHTTHREKKRGKKTDKCLCSACITMLLRNTLSVVEVREERISELLLGKQCAFTLTSWWRWNKTLWHIVSRMVINRTLEDDEDHLDECRPVMTSVDKRYVTMRRASVSYCYSYCKRRQMRSQTAWSTPHLFCLHDVTS